jgi:hypothetical protein
VPAGMLMKVTHYHEAQMKIELEIINSPLIPNVSPQSPQRPQRAERIRDLADTPERTCVRRLAGTVVRMSLDDTGLPCVLCVLCGDIVLFFNGLRGEGGGR